MKIRRLEIGNWGRYREPETISFDTTSDQNILLIYGNNDRGKTTLFYALRYLLYGERGLFNHPNESYRKLSSWANLTSAKQENGTMFVELQVETDDDKLITIERKREFFQTPPEEETTLALKDTLLVSDENGKMDVGKNNQNIEDWIQANVLPYEASQFFLFDGEVIQGYMKKPEDRVRRAIEQVLGLKELKNADEDLGVLIESIGKEITSKSKLSTKDEKVKEQIEKIEIEIKNTKELIEGKNSSLRGANSIIEESNKKLNKNREIQEKNERKTALIEEIKKDKNTILELKTELKNMRDFAGLLLINPLLSIISTTEETPPSKQQWESKVASHLINGHFENCVCETKIDDEVKGKLSEKILDLKDNPFSKLKRLVEDVNARYHPDSKKVEINNIINNIADLESKITSNESAQKSISDEILASGGIGEEVKDLERKQKEALKSIGQIEQELEKHEKYLEAQESKKNSLEEHIAKTTANQELEEAQEMRKYVLKIREVFQTAFSDYFKIQKPLIEKHISDVFVGLTNNPEMYKGIRLGDDFSINILRYDGTLLPSHRYSPSAGASQVAATAMIGGFNKYTTRKAPVFIDTPLARLDPIHKENLLQYYTNISEQVIILPQNDEIDAKEFEIISDFVAETHDIQTKPGEPETSIIVRRKQ